mmetsp:Transcript_5653/g.22228  ORF Transcript_5653/g.22228 Transcript_5653/m.22228 type:complete len:236 (+) Transcript_5653:266-973(+)
MSTLEVDQSASRTCGKTSLCCFALSSFACCSFVAFCTSASELWTVEKMLTPALSAENLFFHLDAFCCIVPPVDLKPRSSHVPVPASGSCKNFSASIAYTQPIFCTMICPKDALAKVCATGRIVSTNCAARSFSVPIFESMSTYTSHIAASLIANLASRRFCSKSCSSPVKSVPAMASDASCNLPTNPSICSLPNNMPKNAAGFTIGTSPSASFPRASYLRRKLSSLSTWYASPIS